MTYNKHHYENVANIQKSIESDVCNEVTVARSNKLLESWLTKKHKRDDNIAMWKRINAIGSFPGDAAVQAGFVDSLPRRDPLSDLVNKEICDKEENVASSKWKPHETDFASFPSNSTVSLKQYAVQVASKKKTAQRKQFIEDIIERSTYLKQIVSFAAGNTKLFPGNTVEQIALLYVDGMIGNDMAGKLVDSIRKIRKNDKTKCLVVRVSSGGGSVVACETIQQELKALDIPVVFSFGNVSASGGYYISSFADRIFCSKKTITGSIGVFGIRPDLTGLAAKFGINVDHVASGDLAGIYMPFHPMSSKMKQKIATTIDRHYSDFKNIVSQGRCIPVDSVEAIAQGRVWTGSQGKEIGLIDEVGSLHRAIAYARRTYTSNKHNDGTDVVVWPQKPSAFQKLMGLGNEIGAAFTLWDLFSFLASGETDRQREVSLTSIRQSLSGTFMVADEDTAIRCLLEDANIESPHGSYKFPDSFWQ
jgi:signal peptide peptidase SppA